MSNKIMLVFGGDSKQLERTFDRVGESSRKFGKQVEDDSDSVLDSFGKLGRDAAGGFSLSFTDRLGPLVAKAPISGPLAAAFAAAAPAAAAALTTGLLLGLGGGVLAAGIASAAKDPKVAAAFSGLKDRASKAFAGFGEPFKAPLIRAADTFGDALERMAPALNRMGATVAPLIDILAPALAEMAEKSLPGIEKAVVASVPLFEKLAEHAPEIGAAVSTFFEKIAEGAPSAVKFLDILLQGAEVTLPLLADSLRYLTEYFLFTYEVWSGIFRGISAGWEGLKKGVSGATGFVVGKFNALVGFLGGLRRRVGGAFSGMFDGIKVAFRSAVNWVIDRWNNFSIPGINTPFGTIGGFNTPDLPRFHQGGIVPGAPGQEVVALLQAGERVTPAGASGSASTFSFTVGGGGSASDRALAEVFLGLMRKGAIQLRDSDGGRVVVASG